MQEKKSIFFKTGKEIITYEKDDLVIKSNFDAANRLFLAIDEPDFSGDIDNGLDKMEKLLSMEKCRFKKYYIIF